jgi:hypothetical protein
MVVNYLYLKWKKKGIMRQGRQSVLFIKKIALRLLLPHLGIGGKKKKAKLRYALTHL